MYFLPGQDVVIGRCPVWPDLTKFATLAKKIALTFYGLFSKQPTFANFLSCNWPNIEKIIEPSSNTGAALRFCYFARGLGKCSLL